MMMRSIQALGQQILQRCYAEDTLESVFQTTYGDAERAGQIGHGDAMLPLRRDHA
jgi:hypothetical protein